MSDATKTVQLTVSERAEFVQRLDTMLDREIFRRMTPEQFARYQEECRKMIEGDPDHVGPAGIMSAATPEPKVPSSFRPFRGLRTKKRG